MAMSSVNQKEASFKANFVHDELQTAHLVKEIKNNNRKSFNNLRTLSDHLPIIQINDGEDEYDEAAATQKSHRSSFLLVNNKEQEKSKNLEWFYDYILKSKYVSQNQRLMRKSDFLQMMNIIGSTYWREMFHLLNNDGDDCEYIAIGELIGGFRKVITHAVHESIMANIVQIILKYSKEKSGFMSLLEFHDMLNDADFQNNFYFIFQKGPFDDVTCNSFASGMEKLACLTTDEKYLTYMSEIFCAVAQNGNTVDRKQFKDVLNAKQHFIADRIFDILSNGEDSVKLNVLLDGLARLFIGSDSDKIDFLFDIFNLNNDDELDIGEMTTILRVCVNESVIGLTEEEITNLAKVFIEYISKEVDVEHDDVDNKKKKKNKIVKISKDQFHSALQNHPDILKNIRLSATNLLKFNFGHEETFLRSKSRTLGNYIKNNISYLVFIIGMFSLNVVLAAEAASRYLHTARPWLVSARAFGQLLNFNSAFIFLFVCRYILTFIRATRFALYLPVDSSLQLHKVIGILVVLYSVLHTISHLINFNLLANEPNNTLTYFELLFTTKSGIGWVYGSACITGWILLGIILCMAFFSLPVIRRNGFFQAFYWVHHLFILYTVVLFLHGRHFWKWMIAPCTAYLFERILRLDIVKKVRYGRGYFKIIGAEILPGKVVCLVIERPHLWTFNAGDYIYICIPKIAKFEYHPFTISSAPENSGVIWLHIRVEGNWTTRLYNFVDALKKNAERIEMAAKKISSSGQNRNLMPTSQNKKRLSVISFKRLSNSVEPLANDISEVAYVDGPFGTPTMHIFDAEHAVLICTGIGVTPFASILQSIYMRYIQTRLNCPRCQFSFYNDVYKTFALKKVDFYWMNRNHKAFAWFTSIMKNLEDVFHEMEHNNNDKSLLRNQFTRDSFISLNLFLTGALPPNDIKNLALKLALDFSYKKYGKDVLSGLQSRIETGRPTWRHEFQQIHRRRQGNVTIFYCGPPALSKELQQWSNRFGFYFREEVF